MKRKLNNDTRITGKDSIKKSKLINYDIKNKPDETYFHSSNIVFKNSGGISNDAENHNIHLPVKDTIIKSNDVPKVEIFEKFGLHNLNNFELYPVIPSSNDSNNLELANFFDIPSQVDDLKHYEMSLLERISQSGINQLHSSESLHVFEEKSGINQLHSSESLHVFEEKCPPSSQKECPPHGTESPSPLEVPPSPPRTGANARERDRTHRCAGFR